jgi:hypothetical protein
VVAQAAAATGLGRQGKTKKADVEKQSQGARVENSALRWVGLAIVAVLVVVAIMTSRGDRHMRDGMTGSYLGRQVADGASTADKQKVLSDRVTTQRY